MSYDEGLAGRMRRIVGGKPGVAEKRMFGGVAFMLNGNMFTGVIKDELLVRVGLAGHDEAVPQPHARPMDFTGRRMVGFVQVRPEGFADQASLGRWLERGIRFASGLPAKEPGSKTAQGKQAAARAKVASRSPGRGGSKSAKRRPTRIGRGRA
jgi:TfoX/Sxy family transcriptional regulator of competence genes